MGLLVSDFGWVGLALRELCDIVVLWWIEGDGSVCFGYVVGGFVLVGVTLLGWGVFSSSGGSRFGVCVGVL